MKNKSVYWDAAITNIVSLAAFTALAIIFHRWWIVLFDLLFCYSVKVKPIQKHYRICDGCGRHGPVKDTYNEALDAAKEAGWYGELIKLPDGTVQMNDYCPECRKRLGI